MVVNTKSDQQSGKEDLYTVLGFKGKGDFQDKMNNIFSNDNKELKKLRDKLFGKLKKKIMTDEKNNQAAKNVNDQITKSKTTESKLSNLLEFKKQLEAFLKDQDNHGIVFNEIDSVSVAPVVEVNGINPKWSKIKKLKKAQPLTSNEPC
ncbi:MAG: hypothetical protein PV345_05720 [Wolbachia sp.]|nr:hypothetical protein [Wolbachia sp.]